MEYFGEVVRMREFEIEEFGRFMEKVTGNGVMESKFE